MNNIPTFFKAYLQNLHPKQQKELRAYLYDDHSNHDILDVLFGFSNTLPKLYVRQYYRGDGVPSFWVCLIDKKNTSCFFGKSIYFQKGTDVMAPKFPTWFYTKQEAIESAEKQGFIVEDDT
jgi:hypothetical protein